MANLLRVLHTSDWHLGKSIKGLRREAEFRNILEQVYQHITIIEPHLLLIAGDIFDSTLPPVWAQELYYSFLVKLQKLDAPPQVIITAGNHDSPALIDAPKHLLSAFNVKVIGGANLEKEEHIVPIWSKDKELIAIILAVPYLRDTQFSKGKTESRILSWQEELHDAMRSHYKQLIQEADLIRGDKDIPIIAMGHLFMQGGIVNEHDGTRPSIGTLGAFTADTLFEQVDYLALGHLHQSQTVAGRNQWRYSGSLLHASFSEKLDKSLTQILFDGKSLSDIALVSLSAPVPFISLSGSWEEQENKVLSLLEEKRACYIELNVHRDELMKANALYMSLQTHNGPTKIVQITRIDKPQLVQLELSQAKELVSLHKLEPLEIFKKRLEREDSLDTEVEESLIALFQYIEQSILEKEERE